VVVVGHAFVKARFRGKDVVEFEKILIDTGAVSVNRVG